MTLELRIREDYSISYEIRFLENLFLEYQEVMHPPLSGRKCIAFVDSNVNEIYGDRITGLLKLHKDYQVFRFKSGEASKSTKVLLDVLTSMDNFGIERRNDIVLGVGGGVLTDVVGFAASVYRRGVPFYSVPTTLMGMVDAAIGIKNGVNFNQSKNRLGTFRSPAKVLIDFRFLNNLSDRHISNGLAEVIKLGIIHNKEVFDQLHAISDSSAFANRQDGSLSRLCVSAIETVTNELSGNLTERKLARALDFGHTFSPAIEMRYNQFLHGEAVAIDMHISTEIAASRGLLDPPEHAMILAILEKFNLHRIPIELEPQTLWDSIVERTAHRGGSQNIPLPDKIGSCVFVQDVNLSEVASSVDRVNERVVSGKPRGIVASK